MYIEDKITVRIINFRLYITENRFKTVNQGLKVVKSHLSSLGQKNVSVSDVGIVAQEVKVFLKVSFER